MEKKVTIKHYNENNKVIYKKDSNGYESWYDSSGNETHYRDSNGYEQWSEYDSNGNKIPNPNQNNS